ncbi:hypothetical protein J8I87_05545 [Paraburkholderia sp. LEh10]|uniref:hypothetical protein n=1 Tax=Paraburkholderia sp. LEh10 TaxID=2821353 RepID=UPI001AE7F774|nr:hypothetical protein [Paraburkholderia sp. LEh10]MBP0589189.1 hypothetical protein [Paraburkholderia sp. LEh10]
MLRTIDERWSWRLRERTQARKKRSALATRQAPERSTVAVRSGGIQREDGSRTGSHALAICSDLHNHIDEMVVVVHVIEASFG